MITYTVDNCCGFWHCQGVISLPEIANSICGGTGCSCGCSAKTPVASPDTEECADSSTTLGSLFRQGGLSRAATNPPPVAKKQHHLSSGSWVTTCQNPTAVALFGSVAINNLLIHPQILYSLCWVGFKICPCPGAFALLQRECARAVMGQWWCVLCRTERENNVLYVL